MALPLMTSRMNDLFFWSVLGVSGLHNNSHRMTFFFCLTRYHVGWMVTCSGRTEITEMSHPTPKNQRWGVTGVTDPRLLKCCRAWRSTKVQFPDSPLDIRPSTMGCQRDAEGMMGCHGTHFGSMFLWSSENRKSQSEPENANCWWNQNLKHTLCLLASLPLYIFFSVNHRFQPNPGLCQTWRASSTASFRIHSGTPSSSVLSPEDRDEAVSDTV